MANGDQVFPFGTVNRGLPGSVADNQTAPFRLSRHGELLAQSVFGTKMAVLANEGSYFVATNTTPGTGIGGRANPASLADTTALVHLFNSASAAEGTRLYLDFLFLRVTAAGTNGTNFNLTQKLDVANNRYTSGGSAITPVNPNIDSTTSPKGVLKFGDLTTAAASSSARIVHHEQARSVIKVVGDKYMLHFGSSAHAPAGMILEGTAQIWLPIHCPPVVIGPGQQWLLHEWAASQTVAAAYEFVMGWWER